MQTAIQGIGLVDTMKRMPDPKTETIYVRVSKKEKAEYDEAAAIRDLKQSEWIRQTLNSGAAVTRKNKGKGPKK